METTVPAEVPSPQVPNTAPGPRAHPHMRIYGHSPFLYWWPVWVVGFAMTLLTYAQGVPHRFGEHDELIHPSSNLGVLFFFTIFAVILITNFSVNGTYSGMVVLGMALVAVILAYFSLWDTIFGWVEGLHIHMNLGAYFWFSSVMFLTWCLSVFVFDHLSYWEVTSGQLTLVYRLGTSSKSYNTQGMVLEKHRSDLFRHWILGLGTGDMIIRTTGAAREEIDVPNVLFVGSKVEAVQRLIAEEPE